MKTPISNLQNLVTALRELGWKTPQIKALLKTDRLANLHSLLELSPHLLDPPKKVDLSASVDVPGLSVNWNLKQGPLVWNPDSFILFQTEAQKKGNDVGWIPHAFFIRDNYSPLNACLLDYLLEYPYLIPRRWRHYFDVELCLKQSKICFLGTTYLNEDRNFFVRGMYFDGKIWREGFWSTNQTSQPDFQTIIPRASTI